MNKKGFIYGSFLLVFVNLIVKIIDFSYDIILAKFIGAEGMGLFQMAMSVLMISLIFSMGGISTAVSKLVARENSKNNKYAVEKVLKIAILFVIILSIFFSLILICFGRSITLRIFKDENMLPLIYILIPTLLIIPISSIFRGYYYGLKMIMIPSISQIIEHITRFVVILGFLYYVYPVKPIYGAFIAIFGVAVGEFFDLLWLIFMKGRTKEKVSYNNLNKIRSITVLREILYIAIPMGVSGLLNVLLRFANTILIPQKLMEAGYSSRHAIATFGRVTGMTMPLIMLPSIVTMAISTNLIPNLSEQMALKNYRVIKNNISFSIKVTLLASIPITGILACFSEPLGVFLYNDFQVSKFIYILSYTTVLFALQHILTGILHGLNKQIKVTINGLIGMTLQLTMTYFLVGNPKFGINGFFIGVFLSRFTICALDIITLRRTIKLNISYIHMIIRPLIGTAIMISLMYISLSFLKDVFVNNVLAFLFSLIIGGIFYIIVLYIFRLIDLKDSR